jgi:GR25 family glycosyltransferase involved in LPS biosynthesis
MIHRTDLWDNLKSFRDDWEKIGTVNRIVGTDYTNKKYVLNEYITNNRINLNGSGFRNNMIAFLGELGCYNSHYDSWKYVVENKLEYCLILEDGITFLRNDYINILSKEHINMDIIYINEEMTINNNKFVGYGTQGYIVSFEGAKKLLTLCCTLLAPIDLQIRHLCNTKELNATILNKPFVKRNNNRVSSISIYDPNHAIDLNAKQNGQSIIQRILNNLIKNNVNLDDYI